MPENTAEIIEIPGTARAAAESVPALPADTWAVVEVFGHRSHVGRVSEVAIAGRAFVKIETPALPEIPASERPGEKRMHDYDDSNRYVPYTKQGRYVREAVPAVPSEPLFYSPEAIFSIRPCTQEQAEQYHRLKVGCGSEEFVPDDTPALPAPAQSFEESIRDVAAGMHDSMRRSRDNSPRPSGMTTEDDPETYDPAGAFDLYSDDEDNEE